MIFKNRRGSLADSIFVPLYIVGIAMTIFVAYFVWLAFVDAATPTFGDVTIPDGRTISDLMVSITASLGLLDYMFPFIVLGLLLVSLIFAYKTGASIIYSYVSIFFWILAVMMSVIFSNIFEAFAANFTSIGNVFLIIAFFMDNIIWISLGWAVLISIVMFTRDQRETQALAAQEMAFGGNFR